MTAYSGQTQTTVRCRTGLPITAGCDTAWIQTRYYSDTSCTEMQFLRPLCHSGALINECCWEGKGTGSVPQSRILWSRCLDREESGTTPQLPVCGPWGKRALTLKLSHRHTARHTLR